MSQPLARIILGVLSTCLLAGCGSSVPRKNALYPVTQLPGHSAPPAAKPITAPPPKPAQVIAKAPTPPPAPVSVVTNIPDPAPALIAAAVPEPPKAALPATGWIALEDWSSNNGLPKPQRLVVHATNIIYRVQTDAGTLAVTVGSKLLSWNGITCWLGYAPLLIDNRVLIHALDAQKTLEPLALKPPPEAKAGRVVLIDPGHGGENPGAQSLVDRHWEKEFTLDWALRLQDLLLRQGWIVYLTRKDDSDMSLPARVEMAERLKADLFISLHFNSATPHREPSGIETYCVTPTGLPSSLVRDARDDLAVAFPNNSHDTENVHFAERLQRSLIEATGAVDRGVKRARFMGVLTGQGRPAVLIEGGFLSNPTEGKRISTPAYRQKLAEAVAKALE